MLSAPFNRIRYQLPRSLISTVLVAAAIITPIQIVGSPAASADPASGTISGSVFRDFGMDGSYDDVDAGEPGIEVRVFDDENAVVGPVTSADDGTYQVDLAGLTETSNDTYRVEFTIPSTHTYLRNSFVGDDNEGPVQFIQAGSTDANFGVTNPAQFCEANPSLALTCWVNGQADGDTSDGPNDSDALDALITLPWDGHSSTATGGDLTLPSNPSHIAYNGEIGTTWGVAHQRSTDSLFIGAAQRRHAGFGPGGTGMIYRASVDGSSVTPFLDLNALGIATGADPHTGLPDQSWVQSNPEASASYDPASFDAVGKISLGDIDISEDGETLWAVNLNNRTLLEIPIGPTGTAPAAAEITQHNLGSAVTCNNGEFRPFGLGVRDGLVYAGGVCSGENGGDATDVVSHVLTHDPNGVDSNFSSVYSLPMNYRSTLRPTNEECAFRLNFSDGSLFGAIGCDGWGPWASSWDDLAPEELILSPNHRFYAGPQPMLTDIEIDADGSIVLAFADRFGMQSGFRNYDDSGTNTDLHSGTTGGDLIRICNDTGSLTFPCRADNSEFYVGDNAPGASDLHPESSWGAIAMHFGNGEVAMTIADPINVWSGGVGWFDKVTGLISTNSPADTLRRYEVFEGGSDNLAAPPSGQTGVGKAAGLGDIELVCDVAPFQIGNRAWFDRNANGRQDPSEPALPNVTVHLIDNGSIIATTTTDESGSYTFSSLDVAGLTTLSDYTIEFDSSTADVSAIEGIADASLLKATVQDAAGADDNDDSDIDPATNQIDMSTGTSGTSTFTLDAGFTGGLQIGNMVWFDANDNGIAEDGEQLVAGITLNLFRENGAAGFDGTEELVEVTTTDENGLYLFRQIIDGETYYVAIPEDQSASTIEVDGVTLDSSSLMTTSASASGGPDNIHDGTPFPGFLSVTEAVTPSDDPASEPTGETDAPPTPDTDSEAAAFAATGHFIDDDDSDLTRDFGIVQKMRIGNLVWLDGEFGDEGFNNGVADPSESDLGLGGVTVELFADDGDGIFEPDGDDTLVDSTVTDEEGRYWFEDIEEGDYIVAIPRGQTGQTLDGETVDLDTLFRSSPAASPAADGIDDINDGSATTEYASVSDVFTASPGMLPVDEAGDFGDGDAEAEANTATGGYVDSFSDLTIDFSFVEQPVFSIGNLVWADLNDDGIAQAGEPGIEGVTVELRVAGETAVYASTVTDADGKYVFVDIPAGDYEVVIEADQAGQLITGESIDLSSLLPGSTVAPDANDDTDNDNNGVGTATLVSSAVSLGDPDPYNPTEPTDETLRADDATDDDTSATDAASNWTVDFGFVIPARIGNLVWLDNGGGQPGDANYDPADENDGEADPTESGIAGVLVQLLDDEGEVVFETVTDELGRYWVPASGGSDYRVAIPADQTPVVDLTLTPDPDALDGLSVSSVSSTEPDQDDDVNDGTRSTGFAALTPTFSIDGGSEPTDENGDFEDASEDAAETDANNANSWLPDENSNLAIDIGFAPTPTYAIGNLVWADLNDDGIAQAGEPGIEGVTVELREAGGTTVIASVVTDADGKYVFTDIPAGDYEIVIDAAQSGQIISGENVDLSTLLPGSTVAADANDDTDNDNNGVGTATLVSSPVSLGDPDPNLPNEPTDETLRDDDPADDDTTDGDATSNLTVDFGFVIPARIGNLVWLDNGGGQPGDANYDPADENDGEADPTESGIAGVLVQLLDDEGEVVFETITDELGRYWVTGVSAEDYQVAIPADQTPVLDLTLTPDPAALEDLSVSSVSSSDPSSDDDVNDANSNDDFAALSSTFSIGVGTEPTDESGDFGDPTEGAAESDANDTNGWLPDENSNLAIDIGFAPTPKFSVGNLVWEDYDNDGVADAGEPGIAGVLVQLLDEDGEVVAELLTDEAGNYRFDDVDAGVYTIRIPDNQEPEVDLTLTPTPGALDGLEPSSSNTLDPDNPDSLDHDSNGVVHFGGVETGEFELGNGDSHEEPEGESVRSDDPTTVEPADQRTDRTELTVDFGFWRGLRLGNQVWLDGVQGEAGYDNGIMDPGEVGLAGVTVALWADTDDDGVAEPGGDDTMVETTITDDEGNYWFTGLEADQPYFVVIDNPDGLESNQEFSSTGASSDPAATDNDDDGAPKEGRSAVSEVLTLAANAQATGETDVVPAEDAELEANTVEGATTPDANSELRVDFGFIEVPHFRLGNLVWDDVDADGIAEDGESGIAGVLVQLLSDDTVIAETVTDADGSYVFENLVAGDYRVNISGSQTPELGDQSGLVPGALDGFRSSSANESTNPNDDVDNDDNGVGSELAMARSAIVTLGPDSEAPSFETEPTDETLRDDDATDDDANAGEAGSYPDSMSNLTVDFGFYRLTLGNQVWFDSNADGIKDDGEPGINGVTVTLVSVDDDGNETVVAETVTGNDGEDGMFLFDGLIDGEEYLVEIAASEFEPGQPLAGMFSSPDADPVHDVSSGTDNDDNGVDPEPGDPLRTEPVVLNAGEAPTGEDPAGSNPAADISQNVTVDLGLVGLAVGDTVWLDENGNGVIDDDEPGIADVTVELWTADETGTPTGEEPVATTTTDADGTFLFSGLEEGSFVLILPSDNFDEEAPLEGLTSTIGNGVVAPGPNDDVDSDDNGNLDPTGQYISTGLVELSFASEPTGEDSADPAGFDPANTNLAVDFGLVPTPPMSIGNLVWNDLNNNGIADVGEPGLGSVVVELWEVDSNGEIVGTEPVATTTSDPDGDYLFEGVNPGTFAVVLPASNFVPGGPAHGLHSSTADPATDPDDDVDSDDNGVDPAEFQGDVVSLPISLVPSWEPLEEPGAGNGAGSLDGEPIHDSNSNISIDFGLVSVGIGDRVWVDADNSGTFDESEVGVAGVEVQLVDADGNVVDSATTDSDGYYLFVGFAPGDYRVVVVGENFEDGGPLDGHYSSTGNGEAPDPDDDVDLDDNGDPVGGDDSGSAGVSSELVTIVAGSEPTEDTRPADLADTDDTNINSTVDFGFYTAELTTTLWIDENDNGVFDGGEQPLDSVRVNLLVDGVPQTTAGVAVSNPDGSLAFTGIPESTVRLHFPGSNFEARGPLDGIVLDSTELDPDGGMTSTPIEVVAGSTHVDLLEVLGSTLLREATVGDTIWDDQNRNGIQDLGEPGIADVELTLFDSDGEVVATTTTEADGTYLFDNLPPGDYAITMTLPDGLEVSAVGVGDDTLDSDFDTSTLTATFTLSAGENNNDIDGGLHVPAEAETGSLGTPPASLAFSGSSSAGFTFIALLLVGGGLGLLAVRRRRLAAQ